jgi:hypothetical protein
LSSFSVQAAAMIAVSMAKPVSLYRPDFNFTYTFPRRWFSANASGRRSLKRQTIFFPFLEYAVTLRSGANSLIVWRQDPHGGAGSSDSLAIAISSNSRIPLATAADTATRSAHKASPYAAFSTLHPVTISPDEARNAAPTRNLEYGAYAFSIAANAASRSSSSGLTALC